jgi:hypothetical protein
VMERERESSERERESQGIRSTPSLQHRFKASIPLIESNFLFLIWRHRTTTFLTAKEQLQMIPK